MPLPSGPLCPQGPETEEGPALCPRPRYRTLMTSSRWTAAQSGSAPGDTADGRGGRGRRGGTRPGGAQAAGHLPPGDSRGPCGRNAGDHRGTSRRGEPEMSSQAASGARARGDGSAPSRRSGPCARSLVLRHSRASQTRLGHLREVARTRATQEESRQNGRPGSQRPATSRTVLQAGEANETKLTGRHTCRAHRVGRDRRPGPAGRSAIRRTAGVPAAPGGQNAGSKEDGEGSRAWAARQPLHP